jgi:2-oxoglutarate ferredoxin oxidoreductase subunit beta
MDGEFGVESMKRALQNKGFSLIHVVFPCITNFASSALGSRDAVKMFRWIKDHSCRLDEELTEDTIWRTGIYHDASNSRLDFATLVRNKQKEIQRRLAA